MKRFKIDFFQLEKLIEASWSASTILQFCVLQELIDLHYYDMSDNEKKAIHSFFETKMNFERQLYNADTDVIREKIIARFDLNNQYFLKGENQKFLYFKYKEKFWKNSIQFISASEVVESESFGQKIIEKKTA